MKNSNYRYWIENKGYYEFKTFIVYWAYRWYIAKELDKKGFGIQTKDDPIGLKETKHTNFAERYT